MHEVVDDDVRQCKLVRPCVAVAIHPGRTQARGARPVARRVGDGHLTEGDQRQVQCEGSGQGERQKVVEMIQRASDNPELIEYTTAEAIEDEGAKG